MNGVLDPARLRALLGSEEWRWWRERVRSEIEGGRPIPATVTRQEPSPAEREAANRLLGTPGANGPVRIKSAEIENILREAGIADDLKACIALLDGPLVNRAAQREASEAAWKAVNGHATALLTSLCAPESVQSLIQSGVLKRLSANAPGDARLLVERAAVVLSRLRAGQKVHLAELAAAAVGDAHALDRESALGRLVLRLSGNTTEDGVLAWRAAWLSLGVQVDAVSASTLVLNLPAVGESRFARVCSSMRGEPLRFTARQLEREQPAFSARDVVVFACENPTVVAAAANALGERCPPLVCVDGRATTPSLLLLRQLRQDGAVIRYQGDADWPGIEIASDLRRHVDLQPWRLTSEELPRLIERPGPPLAGSLVTTPWDPKLADALARRGRALHEETVLDLLLTDLGIATRPA